MNPLVSAVIPTLHRPALVRRAVESVLAQTYANLEIVVAIDGPDEATREALAAIHDARLRVVALDENVGGSEARNVGVRAARGEWIALLDDDDEWLPEKIERQVRAATAIGTELVLVGSRFATEIGGRERIFPVRVAEGVRRFQPGEYSEHLFCPSGLMEGGGWVQTSTFLMSRALAERVPFLAGLKRYQDTDWVLRALATAETRYQVLPEVLVRYSADAGERVSKGLDWRFLLGWAVERRELFSAYAFAYFLATAGATEARLQGERLRGGWAIWRAMRNGGRVGIRPYARLVYHLTVSERVHGWIRAGLRVVMGRRAAEA